MLFNDDQRRVPGHQFSSKPHPHFTVADPTYAHTLYRDDVNVQGVDAFLEESSEYDCTQNLWFPEGGSIREHLLDSAFKLLTSVLRYFGGPSQASLDRNVVKTPPLLTPEGQLPSQLAIQAHGPSFGSSPTTETSPLPIDEPTSCGPANVATYVLIKLDTELGSDSDNVEELETYARKLFRAQPNRIYVRSLVLTEHRARLVHFDRAGAQITPAFDIHKHPETLIRLVMGLSSTDERLLGFDTRIQWSIVDGKKIDGTLTTRSPDGGSKTYSIVEQIPIPCDPIRSRGTVCWKVQDPDSGEEYVVKDTWRPEEWSSEHELLELVKGIPGVVQMVSFETGEVETKDFRCPSTFGSYHNRIATRITTKAYGKPVDRFTSVLQLLYAIRDAIAGHRRLVGDDLRILHRDISSNNVLLGNDGAPEGYRGVLIDLELAFKATPETLTSKANHNLGTRTFQSLSVLSSHTLPDNRLLPHGYLDDLESFFYVLVYIFLLFRPDGSPQPPEYPARSIPYGWGMDSADAAAFNKFSLFDFGAVSRLASQSVESAWGPTCFKLFKDFRDWISDMTDERTRLWEEYTPFDILEDDVDPLEPLLSQREEHYSEVLKMFDETISEIEALPTPTAVSMPPIDAELHNVASPPLSPNAVVHGEIPASKLPALAISAPVPQPTVYPPTFVQPHNAPLPPKTQPRRSARIRDLKHSHSRRPPPLPADLPPFGGLPPPGDPPALHQPRRSARLAKRRHCDEDDCPAEPRPSKVRRTKSSGRTRR